MSASPVTSATAGISWSQLSSLKGVLPFAVNHCRCTRGRHGCQINEAVDVGELLIVLEKKGGRGTPLPPPCWDSKEPSTRLAGWTARLGQTGWRLVMSKIRLYLHQLSVSYRPDFLYPSRIAPAPFSPSSPPSLPSWVS
nr:hypothetical protein Itr_chr11CG19000 [Ipomoea trifida]